MKKAYKLAPILFGLGLHFVTLQSALADPPYSTDYWISSTNNPGGTGELSNPFDGSSQANFDAKMNSLPTNCTIHLLSGTYQTKGSVAWLIKTGQKIIGSGIDNTILHLSNVMAFNGIGTALTGATNVEVSDLTIDGSGTINDSGLFMQADHSAIRRVKAVNFSNSTSEIFIIGIASYCGSCGTQFYSEGNVIEDCEVNITDSGPFSAITLGGAPTLLYSSELICGTSNGVTRGATG